MTTTDRRTWDWKLAVSEARERLKSRGFPIPLKPQEGLSDLTFPTDVESLNPIQLGNLKLKYTAWYAFVSSSLAFAKAEFTAIEDVLEAQLGEAMYQMGKTMDGRAIKDILRSRALIKDDKIGDLFQAKLEAEQNTIILEGLTKSLEISTRGLESEQIRRASERKILAGEGG